MKFSYFAGMKRLPFIFLFLQFFCACTNNNEAPASENDVDAARNFIQSALNGDYRKAKNYIVNDPVNIEYLDAFERNYQNRMLPDDKRGYRESSINIHSVKPLNDSVSIINYSNSYKKQNDSLKVVKTGGKWLVDLKYSFSSLDKPF